MIKRALATAVLMLGALSGAPAQTTLPNLPASSVWGNLSTVTGPSRAVSVAQLQAAILYGERPVSDANYSAVAADRTIAYIALTASRTVTLLPAASYLPGTVIRIIDRSASASATKTISVAPTGADLINGANASLAVIDSAYGGATLESDGVSKWVAIVPQFTSGTTITNPYIFGGAAYLNEGVPYMGTGSCNGCGPLVLEGGGPGAFFHETDQNPYETGIAQAGGATTITLAARSCTPSGGITAMGCIANDYVSSVITITSGTGSGQTRTISAISAGASPVLTVSAWATNPDNTSHYSIGRIDYGWWRVIADGNSLFFENWEACTPLTATFPAQAFDCQDEFMRFMRVPTNTPIAANHIIGFNYPIAGNGNRDWTISANWADGHQPQTARNLTLQSLNAASNVLVDAIQIAPNNANPQVIIPSVAGFCLGGSCAGTNNLSGLAALSLVGNTTSSTGIAKGFSGTASQIPNINAAGTALAFTSTPTIGTSVTVPQVIGGSAAGSTLTLESTSNVSPSGDSIAMVAGGSTRWTMLSNGNIGFGTETNPTQGFWTFSKNATTGFAASGLTTNGLIFIGADAASGGYGTFTFAQAGLNQFSRANNTAASPTALTSGDIIGGMVFTGYYVTGGPAWTPGSKARVLGVVTSAGAWSSTDQGAGIEIDTTAAGGTTRAQAMLVKAGVIVGAGTTDPGAGNLGFTNMALSGTAPTVSAGFCATAPSISANNGTVAFDILVGTGGACGSTGTLGMPTAATGWVCDFHNVTTPASNVVEQTGGATNTVTLTNYVRTTGVAGNFTANDHIRAKCVAY